MLRIVRATLAVGMVGSVWLTAPASAGQHVTDVRVVDNAFDPETVEILVGEEIRWTHEGGLPHSVTRHDDGEGEHFDSHPNCPDQPNTLTCMQGGDTFSHTFQTPGTFTYYCKVHAPPDKPCSGMCGQVVVRAPEAPAPAPEPRPDPQPPAPAPAEPPPPAPEPTPTPEPTPEPTPTEEPEPEVTETPEALADRPEETAARSGWILAAAVLAALLAVGGGLFAWRRLS